MDRTPPHVLEGGQIKTISLKGVTKQADGRREAHKQVYFKMFVP